jgi:hypothetical protein
MKLSESGFQISYHVGIGTTFIGGAGRRIE